MNKIIEQRIKQLISVKFLKSESEITALSMLLNAIQYDFEKIHGADKVNEKQIETRQIHLLNKIQNSFSNGETFLKFFNYKSNNMAFSKFNTMKLMNIVESINNVTSSDIIEALNSSVKSTQKKRQFNKNVKAKRTNTNKKTINVVYK